MQKMKRLNVTAVCLLATSFLTAALHADDKARFDLTGPTLDIRVTRGATSLPIAQVPNLLPGDKIWVKADLPKTQSNHLLLIVAFLRGTTNEPPDNWFTEIDTWDKKTLEGTTVTVPAEAQQALLFIAPETGGDFKTLRSAVKGKPGLFIRADADLNEASFEQQRIERYLDAMKTLSQSGSQPDSKAIAEHSAKLAATLALKPNADCFKQPVEQQVVCLTQSSAPVLMEDGHGQGIAEAVSTGSSSDFINAASYTSPAGGGLYSAYVGAIVDLVHIVSTLRTAQYTYIPGLSFPQGEKINLRLNAPPSFHKPESVIVIGLPAIQKAKLPPIHTHDSDYVGCLLQPKLSIPVEGAPLVYSTAFVHDLYLHLNRANESTDIPLTPDSFEGGLVVTKEAKRQPLHEVNLPSAKPATKLGSATDLTITATVRGFWGFDSFEGPTLTLQQVDGKNFKVVGDTQLLAGQDNHLTLKADGTACVQHIALAPEKPSDKAKEIDVSFKPAEDKDAKNKNATKDTLALAVPLKTVEPGGYSLTIQQYGGPGAAKVPLTAYTAGIELQALRLHTGDDTAILTGAGLKDVASVQIANQSFTPSGDSNNDTTVHLHAGGGVSPANGSEAEVKLKDGRVMKAKVETEAARPTLKLLSFKATPAQRPGDLTVTLGAQNDIPLNGKLTFVVHTDGVFPRSQTIDVATADGSVHTSLSLASNTLVLQDDHTAVAALDPLKAFGQSAFGKLAMRPVAGDGTPGDWTFLGTLVRTPQITSIHCANPNPTPDLTKPDETACTADGTNFFLVQSFAAGKDFAKPTEVPTGFSESSFKIPTPSDGTTLYLKLRDDPSSPATITLPTPIQKSVQTAQPATPPATPPAAQP